MSRQKERGEAIHRGIIAGCNGLGVSDNEYVNPLDVELADCWEKARFSVINTPIEQILQKVHDCLGYDLVAAPIAHLTWHVGCRAPDDCEEYVVVAKETDLSIDGSLAFPVFRECDITIEGKDIRYWYEAAKGAKNVR